MPSVRIPPGACVVLVGPSSSGKSTWAATAARRNRLSCGLVLSSDHLRGELYGDPNVQARDHSDLFGILHQKLDVRLGRRLTTIVDATNLLAADREPIVRAARRHAAPLFAVRFDVDTQTIADRNARRTPPLPPKAVARQVGRFQSECSPERLTSEGFTVLPRDVEAVWLPDTHDGTSLAGPFAVVGDIHGACDDLEKVDRTIDERYGDILRVYVGDVGHKGPRSADAYQLVLDQVDDGRALLVNSNHGRADADKIGRMLDDGLYVTDVARHLRAKADANPKARMVANVAGLAEELAARRDGELLARRIVRHQRTTPAHLLLHGGDLAVTHGGMLPDLLGDTSGHAEKVMLYGTPSGTDEQGRPAERDSWVSDYLEAGRSRRLPQVVYGHITYDRVRDTGLTVGIDTGAGDGGPLTAVVWNGGVVDTIASR